MLKKATGVRITVDTSEINRMSCQQTKDASLPWRGKAGWLGGVNCRKPSLLRLFLTMLILVLNCRYTRDTAKLAISMEYTPLALGVEVRGIDLKQAVPDDVIAQIKEDVYKHRLLIFKNQSVVSAHRQMEISRWFGQLDPAFCQHPKSPHRDVLRVSNKKEEGCTSVGTDGWHVDGAYLEQPIMFSIYHMVSVPKAGNTVFVPLREVLESLSTEKRERWERLWRTAGRRQHVQPHVYPHPVTKQPTLCLHLGRTKYFVWDFGTDKERWANWTETREILQEIDQEITKDENRLVYTHKWEVGDFIISDNLALGHKATPQTQFLESEIGLRVLHRTTVKGKWKPAKGPYS